MRKDKRDKLLRAGWAVGDAGDFLDLDGVEAAMIDVRVALARELRRRRDSRELTQTVVAERVGSSQSRVAKMEAADPSVSLDLLVRSLLGIGVTVAEVGRVIAKAGR